MANDFEEYTKAVGEISMAAAGLEDVVISWISMLAEGDTSETHKDHLLRGLDKNLSALKDRINSLVSPQNRADVLNAIETARQLKNERNESVHGVWFKMVDAKNNTPVGVQRSRYKSVKGARTVEWDLSTPTLEELKKLAAGLFEATEKLHNLMVTIWETDQGVRQWCKSHGFDL